jgi:hypothetical protein
VYYGILFCNVIAKTVSAQISNRNQFGAVQNATVAFAGKYCEPKTPTSEERKFVNEFTADKWIEEFCNDIFSSFHRGATKSLYDRHTCIETNVHAIAQQRTWVLNLHQSIAVNYFLCVRLFFQK